MSIVVQTKWIDFVVYWFDEGVSGTTFHHSDIFTHQSIISIKLLLNPRKLSITTLTILITTKTYKLMELLSVTVKDDGCMFQTARYLNYFLLPFINWLDLMRVIDELLCIFTSFSLRFHINSSLKICRSSPTIKIVTLIDSHAMTSSRSNLFDVLIKISD